jgi:hypothetical protein
MSVAVFQHPGIGHNNPPEPTVLERAEQAGVTISNFLNETPIINEQSLIEAKRLVDQTRGAMAELEAERNDLVRPLNEEVDTINSRYKALHNTNEKKPGILDRLLAEIKARLTAYGVAEEARRIQAAEAAAREAEKAEAAAREAERIEQQAKMDAAIGVLDTGVGQAIADADQKFSEFEKASRFAARAERGVAFRIGDGNSKTLAMRTEKTLVLENYGKAIKAIGPNPKIETAILSAARDYRKLHDKLPDGVAEVSERKF